MPRARARIRKTSFFQNLETLYLRSGKKLLLPMLKANAYGHGAVQLALWLENHQNIAAIGVATFSEAMTLRDSGIRRSRIIVFSDCAPWNEERATLCKHYRLEPVISANVALKEILSSVRCQVPFHLEVNTGMNRLGVDLKALSSIRTAPLSVFSHFAESDLPQSRFTKQQISGMTEALEFVRSKFPNTKVHFANSGGIAQTGKLKITDSDWVRPGLSLYGMDPSPDVSIKGLRPVMTFEAPVLNSFQIEKGERVGYSGTYLAKTKHWVATLGAGYADGIHRSLSNVGTVALQRKIMPILGRISMDLTTIRCPKRLELGTYLEFWGEHNNAWKQAVRGGTIPYELFTSVSERVPKIYEE